MCHRCKDRNNKSIIQVVCVSIVQDLRATQVQRVQPEDMEWTVKEVRIY